MDFIIDVVEFFEHHWAYHFDDFVAVGVILLSLFVVTAIMKCVWRTERKQLKALQEFSEKLPREFKPPSPFDVIMVTDLIDGEQLTTARIISADGTLKQISQYYHTKAYDGYMNYNQRYDCIQLVKRLPSRLRINKKVFVHLGDYDDSRPVIIIKNGEYYLSILHSGYESFRKQYRIYDRDLMDAIMKDMKLACRYSIPIQAMGQVVAMVNPNENFTVQKLKTHTVLMLQDGYVLSYSKPVYDDATDDDTTDDATDDATDDTTTDDTADDTADDDTGDELEKPPKKVTKKSSKKSKFTRAPIKLTWD